MRLIVIFCLFAFCLNCLAAEDELSLETQQSSTEASPSVPAHPSHTKKISHFRLSVAPAIAAFIERSKNADSYVTRTMLGLRLGGDIGNHEFIVELDGFKDHSGASGVDVSRFHQQADFWYHYLFLPDAEIGHPYVGGGLGAQRDVVTTTLFNSSNEDTSELQTQLSLCGGYRFGGPGTVAFWLEGRLTTSSNYDPKVVPSLLLAVGFR